MESFPSRNDSRLKLLPGYSGCFAIKSGDVNQKVTNAIGDEDGVYALCGIDFHELEYA